MDIRAISPDELVYWQWEAFSLNATIVFTWAVMALLVIGSWAITRRLTSDVKISRWQNFLEIIVKFTRNEIREASHQEPDIYLTFIGSLFLFIGTSNFLMFVPGFISPTASLSTTAALAICVFIAVPIYGIRKRGFFGYLKLYVQPSFIMLPFNIMGELSRTLALAVRLFGNIMSGTKIAAILLLIVPFVFPALMQLLGLLTGMIQAYIFGILAIVYIASATRAHSQDQKQMNRHETG
ncbi:MAG: F0F1 ATP synthase subunit A [Desulfobacterales bacterium]